MAAGARAVHLDSVSRLLSCYSAAQARDQLQGPSAQHPYYCAQHETGRGWQSWELASTPKGQPGRRKEGIIDFFPFGQVFPCEPVFTRRHPLLHTGPDSQGPPGASG